MDERFDARDLRRRMTPAERRLWAVLRDTRLHGVKFRRQHPVGKFVLDFYCPPAALAIEVDGEVHLHQAEYDEARTTYLESFGIRVIRFQNDEVLSNLAGVLERIQAALAPHLASLATTPYQLEIVGFSSDE
jgi:very-short-patch-repair endonuclease